MSAEAHLSKNHESLLFLPDKPSPRPYQAYCITEASSRPPSPEVFTPQPCCIPPSPIKECAVEPQFLSNSSATRLLANKVHEDGSPATSPSSKFANNGQQKTSNVSSCWRDTELVDQYHIAQAVTPRGSHPLAGNQIPMYDRAQSQSRMQQSVPVYVATSRAYQRKPLPRTANDADIEPHPLPPLPAQLTMGLDDGRSNAQSDGVSPIDVNQGCTSQEPRKFAQSKRDQSEESFSMAVCSKEDPHRLPPHIAIVTDNQAQLPKKSVTSQDEVLPPAIQVHEDDISSRVRDGESSGTSLPDAQAQLPSSTQLYAQRTALDDMDEDRRAYRRTQPNDAELKYQFGRRPSETLSVPSPTPPLRQSPQLPLLSQVIDSPVEQSTDHDFVPLLLSPSVRPLSESRAGPRPPPWRSYEDLEMQRRTRSEIREREDVRKYRMTLDATSSSSVCKASGSLNSFGESPMRREVEEFRVQVLSIYPDLKFDESGRKEEREWRCCCVVM